MAAPRDFDGVLADLPLAYPGPGGGIAVLRDGQVIARQTWGFADLANRLPFTPRTLFRVCSISKQFTCAAVLAANPDLSALDPHIRAALPKLGERTPAAWHLAQNQSGLRDYWATAMLCGSPVEGVFEIKKRDDYMFADKDGRSIALPGRPYMALRIVRAEGEWLAPKFE